MSPFLSCRFFGLSLALLLCLGHWHSHCGGVYRVHGVEELKKALNSVLKRIKAYPHDLYGLNTRIIFQPGFYPISAEDPYFKDRLREFQKNGSLRASNTWVSLEVQYPRGPKAPPLYTGSLYQGLVYLKRAMQPGLKLSREVTYVARNPRQFLRALKSTVKNRQDTVIRIPFCSKAKCVASPAWIKRFLSLTMPDPDGMRLRIKSRFCSLDQDKYQFFQNRFIPFL